jgi:hypothetical protein
MPVEWERIPDGVAEDFQALDGDEVVGRVYQIPTGPERGLWFWTMVAVWPGPRVTFPTNGTEARRGEAGGRVVEADERLLSRGSGVALAHAALSASLCSCQLPMLF